MKKSFFAVIFLIILNNFSFSQDVLKISTLNQIDSLKTSYNGNVILVNFWASWCKPCVEEFPDLLKIKNNFTDKGLRVIFISLDFPEEIETRLIPFLKANNVDFTTLFCNFKKSEELMDYFDKDWDGAIPATFIFDRNGVLRLKVIGSRKYDFYSDEITKYLD
jgi:thiol-disulfide isomerase/thioredoxin